MGDQDGREERTPQEDLRLPHVPTVHDPIQQVWQLYAAHIALACVVRFQIGLELSVLHLVFVCHRPHEKQRPATRCEFRKSRGYCVSFTRTGANLLLLKPN